MENRSKPLEGKVAVVTGATRHAGRGIAIELGIAGATVYCTGRSTRSSPSSRMEPGTIEETAEMVAAHGGKAIWVQVDHTDIIAVQELFDRVIVEQGRLDFLVNSVSGKAGNDPFLESDLSTNTHAIFQGGSSHIIATYFAAKKMMAASKGLVVCISDKEWDQFYAIEKAVINRLPICLAEEFLPRGVAIMAILPGAFFRCFDIMTEEELRAAAERDPVVLKCHTPRLIGRGVVSLASDPDVLSKTGKLLELHDLVTEYGFTDIDDRQSGEMW